MKARANNVRFVTDETGGAELIFALTRENLPLVRKGLGELKRWLEKGKTLDVDVKEHREKRSADANAYMWKLLEKMSEKLPESKDELYDKMLVEYGVFETVSVRKEAAEAFIRQWKGPVKRLGSGVAEFILFVQGARNLAEIKGFTEPKADKQGKRAGQHIYATIMSWAAANRYNFKVCCQRSQAEIAAEMINYAYYFWRNDMKEKFGDNFVRVLQGAKR